jgi:hypothetical protein
MTKRTPKLQRRIARVSREGLPAPSGRNPLLGKCLESFMPPAEPSGARSVIHLEDLGP